MDNEICEALSRMIEEEKNAEEKARECKRELDSVVAENYMLNGQLQKSNEALRNEKEACKRINQRAVWVGTSILIAGIAVLCGKWMTTPRKNGVAQIIRCMSMTRL